MGDEFPVHTDALNEADRYLQVAANTEACVMLGRALEALCRHILKLETAETEVSLAKSKKQLMLGGGIRCLHD